MDWYVIQAFSNCEKKVKAAIEERIEISGLDEKFGEVMIPTEQVTELKPVSYTHLTLPTILLV